MPRYDFKCTSCNEIFTVSKSMNDDTIPNCPVCSSNQSVNRVWNCVNLGGTCGGKSSSGCSSCSGGNCGSCH